MQKCLADRHSALPDRPDPSRQRLQARVEQRIRSSVQAPWSLHKTAVHAALRMRGSPNDAAQQLQTAKRMLYELVDQRIDAAERAGLTVQAARWSLRQTSIHVTFDNSTAAWKALYRAARFAQSDPASMPLVVETAADLCSKTSQPYAAHRLYQAADAYRRAHQLPREADDEPLVAEAIAQAANQLSTDQKVEAASAPLEVQTLITEWAGLLAPAPATASHCNPDVFDPRPPSRMSAESGDLRERGSQKSGGAPRPRSFA